MADAIKKSMDEIAALITEAGDASTDEIDPTVGQDAAGEAEQDEPVVDEDNEELDADAEEVDEAGDEEDDETDIEEDEGEPEPEYLDLSDDDKVEVMVDGELQLLTLGQLKRAASGEGAIEKRLTEATETRKAAQAERTKWEQERNKQTQALTQAFDALHSLVFQPRVKAPDEALRQKDPNAYLIQKGDYDAEMQRLQRLNGQVQEFYGKIQQDIAESEKEYRRQQAVILAEKLPTLRDKKKGEAIRKDIVDTAMHYGFTAEEIKMAGDHRMFVMAHDAMMWRKSQEKGSEKVLEKAKQVKKKPARTIRSGSVAKKRNTAQNKAKAQKKLKDQAQKSGKVDDIAAFIVR